MAVVTTIFDNPLLHLNRYGLANPTVAWALTRGLFDEWCPGCRGLGHVHARPCASCGGGRPKCETGGPCCPSEGSVSAKGCRRPCRECRGSRLRRDRPVAVNDFGTVDDMAAARRLIPGLRIDKPGLR